VRYVLPRDRKNSLVSTLRPCVSSRMEERHSSLVHSTITFTFYPCRKYVRTYCRYRLRCFPTNAPFIPIAHIEKRSRLEPFRGMQILPRRFEGEGHDPSRNSPLMQPKDKVTRWSKERWSANRTSLALHFEKASLKSTRVLNLDSSPWRSK